MVIEVWFDGATGPRNPGPVGGFGVVIKKDGKPYHQMCGPLRGEISNNVAEHHALHCALLWLQDQGHRKDEIQVYGDSKLVIKQIFGRWKIRGGLYADTARACKITAGQFANLRGRWVPREENGLADDLSKRGVRAA